MVRIPLYNQRIIGRASPFYAIFWLLNSPLHKNGAPKDQILDIFKKKKWILKISNYGFGAGYGLFRTRDLILKKEGNTWFVYYPDSLKGKIREEKFFTDLTLTNANLGEDHLFGKIKVLLCGRGTNVTRISTWF